MIITLNHLAYNGIGGYKMFASFVIGCIVGVFAISFRLIHMYSRVGENVNDEMERINKKHQDTIAKN